MTDVTRTVLRSTVFDAPLDRVWAAMRDFGDWRWLEAIDSNVIEGGREGGAIGAIRDLNSGAAREQLLGLDDHAHVITYTLVEAGWPPVRNYLARISVFPVTDGDRTFVHWTATFDVDAEIADEVAAGVGSVVYEAALDGLRRLLAA